MWKKITAGTLVVAMSSSLVGCFGSFHATKSVYNFNRSVSYHKWVREGIFLGMVIIPVYELATLLDAVILNSLEFWTGRNPIAKAGDQFRVDGKDGSYAVSTLKADGSFDIVAVEANGVVHRYSAIKNGDQMQVRNEAGDLLASQSIAMTSLTVAANAMPIVQ